MRDQNTRIRLRNLSLKKEDNPEFYFIVDEHNAIMEQWNKINKDLFNLKQPKILLLGHKARLKSFHKPMETLQSKFIVWNKKAHELLHEPDFIFSEDEESEIGFIHYTNILRDMIGQLDHHMVLIADNFVKVQQRHSNQFNFVIAITSFALTFIALIVTLFTIF